MTLTRRLFAALAATTLLAAPALATDLQAVRDAGTIRVGMLVDFPPFGIQDASGTPDGYDADVAKALAEHLGVEAQIVPVTGPNRIPYLLSGQVDVLVASLGITAERAERVDFSIPYAGIAIGVYGGTDVAVAGPEDLAGTVEEGLRCATKLV